MAAFVQVFRSLQVVTIRWGSNNQGIKIIDLLPKLVAKPGFILIQVSSAKQVVDFE